MFDSQKSVGAGYTPTVAFLAIAFVFSPAALVFIRPLSYLSLGLAIGCSVVCLTLAGISWKRMSRLPIPELAVPTLVTNGRSAK